MHTRNRWVFALRVLVGLCAGGAPAALAQSGAKPPAGSRPAGGRLTPKEAAAALAAGVESLRANFDAGAEGARRAFAQAVTEFDPRSPTGLRAAALGARLVTQLKALPPTARSELLNYLAGHAEAAAELAFLIDPQRDDAKSAWLVFESVRAAAPKDAERLPAALSALCVVRDAPLQMFVNENTVTAPDPVSVFKHFAANEKTMLFSLQDTPPELLVYVLDAVASPEDMQWALGRFARSGDVGSRFFDIQYDLEAFYRGTDKKVTDAGYTLQNIFRHGGVCADQAYFAVSVGKAIGVPSAYVVGRASEAGHAWVGFLDGNPRNARWNFDAGRYDEFKNNLGQVRNPQTGEPIADSELALLAEMLTMKSVQRHEAVALADGAALVAWSERAPTEASADRALALLEAALKQNPACVPAWEVLGKLSTDNRLTLAHKRKWAEAVRRVCGNKYPDFSLDALTPMVETIEDPEEQGRIWNALFMDFGKRADLGARVRLAEARMWLKAGQQAKALSAYREVVERYANVGPAAIDALAGAKDILFAQKKQEQALAMLESTWKRLPRPDGAARFAMASNWFRAGLLFAAALQEAGRAEQAERVASDLGLHRP